MPIKIRVAQVAQERGINDPTKLSRATGIAYATAYRLWNNDIGDLDSTDKGPGLFVLYRVAKALGVNVVDLIDESDKHALQFAVA